MRHVPLAIILAYAAYLRLYHLGHAGLSYDEIGQALVAQHRLWRAILDSASHAASTPLDYVITYLVLRVGDGDALLRLPAALCGVAAVGALYLLGRDVRDHATGLTAAALLAILPLHVTYSRVLRFYSLAALVVLVAVWLLVRAVQRPSARAWALYGVALLVALYSHYYAGVVLAACAVALLVTRTPRRTLAAFALASLPAVLLFAPWIYYDTVTMGGDGLGLDGAALRVAAGWDRLTILPFVDAPMGRLQIRGSLVDEAAWSFSYAAWGAYALAWGLLPWLRPRSSLVLVLLVPLVGLPALVGLDYLAAYPVANRQALLYAPYLLLGGAAALVYVARLLVRREALVAALCVAALWGSWAALRPVQPDIRGRSVGVREVARRLLVEMGPDDVLVSGHLEHLAWYAPELRAQMVQPRTPATAAAWLAAFDASAYPAVYVYPWTPGWTKPLTDWSRAQGAEAIGPRSARIWRIVSD